MRAMAAKNQNTRFLRAGVANAACGFARAGLVGCETAECAFQKTGTVLTEYLMTSTRGRLRAGILPPDRIRVEACVRCGQAGSCQFARGRSMSFTPMELMICCAARELDDGKTVAVGTGLPCAAAMLAQRTHAPNLVVMFEAGGIAPQLPTMPVSVGDSTTFHRAVLATSMADVMQFCQRGMVDYTFLSGAQIDPYGNAELHRDWPAREAEGASARQRRGMNDLASFFAGTLIVMKHDAQKFVEKLDFMTTPGFLTGPGAREAAGLPANTGPHRVITDLCVLDFSPDTKRMRVKSLHPGKTLEQVKAATGFALWRCATRSARPSSRTRSNCPSCARKLIREDTSSAAGPGWGSFLCGGQASSLSGWMSWKPVPRGRHASPQAASRSLNLYAAGRNAGRRGHLPGKAVAGCSRTERRPTHEHRPKLTGMATDEAAGVA